MSPPNSSSNDLPPAPSDSTKHHHTLAEREREAIAVARRHFEGSWLQHVAARLKTVDFVNSIVLIGAALLLSVLPLLILLSSIANERIDDDLSRHIGLNAQGAHIIEHLFRHAPSHAAGPIILGLIIAFAGTLTVAGSLRLIYERVFGQEHRGWQDISRFIVWILALFGLLIAEGSYDQPVREAVGPVVRAVLSLVVVTSFFWWTMHLLLAGRVPWRELIRPALVTGLLWVVLALFSSLYFSSALISENKLYGTLGVVFILTTWFIAIAAVVVLGAACGAVWQERARRAGALKRLAAARDRPV